MKSNYTTILVLSSFLFFGNEMFSQNIAINTTGAGANAAALLDVGTAAGGDTKGILIPRVALTNIALWAPLTPAGGVTGMLVYSTAAPTGGGGVGYYYWDGAQWVMLLHGGSAAADWLTSGNASTSPGTTAAPGANFIGTTDAQDFAIRTAGTERMRVFNAANAGVQITDVSTPTVTFLNTTGVNQPNHGVIFFSEQATEGMKLFYDGTLPADGKFHVIGRSVGVDSYWFTVERASGNVGINKTSPLSKLHLYDATRGNLELFTTGANPGHDFAYDGGGDEKFYFTHIGPSTGTTHFRWQNGASDNSLMEITNTGLVGIGTGAVAPASRLHVNGPIRLGLASATSGSLIFNNSTNAFTVTLQTGVTSANHTLTLPASQGGANTYLGNDGAGNLSWSVPGGVVTGTCGSGANYLPKMSTTSAITCSQIFDDGTDVGIGTTVPLNKFQIVGVDNATTTGPILSLAGSVANQVESGRIRLQEDNLVVDGFLGGYLHYNGSTNALHLGVHNVADQLAASDVNAITVRRDNANVGIGVSPGTAIRLHSVASTTTAGDAAIFGDETGASGQVYGVLGQVASTSGNASGVKGVASAATGGTNGVWGTNASTTSDAAGVWGESTAATGSVYGVFGSSQSTTSPSSGVVGKANGTTGLVYGVTGISMSSGGIGVFGDSWNTTAGGTVYGVYGRKRYGMTSGTGYGVYGTSEGTATTNIGGYFTATGATSNYAVVVPPAGGNVGIGTITPNVNAALDIETTDRRILGLIGNGNVITATDGATQAGLVVSPQFSPSASTTDVVGLDPYVNTAPGAGITITNAYGLRVRGTQSGAGTVTNGYGIHVDMSPGFGTTKYAGVFLNGNVGIGTASPSSILNLHGSAPTLTFTHSSGVNQDNTGVISFVEDASAGMQLRYDGANNRFHILGRSVSVDTDVLTVERAGNVGIGCTAPSQRLYVTGNIYATGTVLGSQAACSDIRWKKDFAPVTEALKNVLQLSSYYYHWKTNEFPEKKFSNKLELGMKAQDVEKFFPELIFTDQEGFKYLDYSRLSPILVEAIKEQQTLITSLQEQNEKLNQRLEKVEASLNITGGQ